MSKKMIAAVAMKKKRSWMKGREVKGQWFYQQFRILNCWVLF